MDKTKILVVEDEIIVAKDLQNKLEKLGYSVPAFINRGEDVIQKIEETKPNIVLMDIKLQGKMDGIEASNRMKPHFDIPVVYLTAYADDQTLKRAKMSTPFGYILKPYQTRELHTIIEIALYKHEMEEELKKSEERYRAYVAATSQIIWIIDPNAEDDSDIPTWKAFFVNRDKGTKKEQLWLETVHPDDREKTEQIFSQALKTKRLFEVKFRKQNFGKGYQPILIRGVAVLEKNGHIREWVGTSTEITNYK